MDYTKIIVTAGDISVAAISGAVTGLVICLVTHDNADDVVGEVRSSAPFIFEFSGIKPGQYEVHLHGVNVQGERIVEGFKTAVVVEPVANDPHSPALSRIELVDVPGLIRVELV